MNQASHEIIEVKADDPEGLFAAKVSVFGNVDRNGDVIMPEAWDRTIEKWRLSGKNIPVIWSHDHKNPNAFIGSVDPNDVKIINGAVTVAGKLDILTNPVAAQAFGLLHKGLVTEWSFAYKVNKEKIGPNGERQIFDLDLFEVGPTLVGANPETLTLATKEADSTPQNTTTSITLPDNGTVTLPGPVTVYYPTTTTSTANTITVQEDKDGLGGAVDDAVKALDKELDTLIEEKVGRVISRRSAEKIRAAVAHLNELLSSTLDEEGIDVGSPSEEKAAEQAAPLSEDEQRRAEHRRMGLFLSERGR